MGKNIILCSDGTGNKGGQGADTNVFRLFNAVEIHDDSPRQITFYDDGVGTSKNTYWRAISGAFGFGFEDNILDLYAFLARNYKPEEGDKIYLFGFSRGAATVRAFAGMVQECGLLDINNEACSKGGVFDEDAFQEQLDEARRSYRKIKRDPTLAEKFKRKKAVAHPKIGDADAVPIEVPIEMIGVWDTVSALGFPQDWSRAVDWMPKLIDKLSDRVFPHNYYNYQLSQNVRHVYHALAIDDERQTFHPKVWNEKRADRPAEIEQVWFAGVHSNVGGGYPRSGMSMVALDWMMTRAEHHGIRFSSPRVLDDAHAAANVHGRLYDSRSGAKIYYRYGPRDITELCKNVPASIKIHKSVIERVKRGTARYAPRSLPYDVEIVGTNIDDKGRRVTTAETEDQWHSNHRKIWQQVRKRQVLYRVFLESTLLLVVVAGLFWVFRSPAECKIDTGCPGNWLTQHLADIIHYFLPKYFDRFVDFITVEHPLWLVAIVAYFIILRCLRNLWRRKTQDAAESARRIFLKQLDLVPGADGETDGR